MCGSELRVHKLLGCASLCRGYRCVPAGVTRLACEQAKGLRSLKEARANTSRKLRGLGSGGWASVSSRTCSPGVAHEERGDEGSQNDVSHPEAEGEFCELRMCRVRRRSPADGMEFLEQHLGMFVASMGM